MPLSAILIICLLLIPGVDGWGSAQPGPPAAKPVTVYLFWTPGCPHCDHEKAFLADLARRDPAVGIVDLEVAANRENLELLYRVGKALDTEVAGVPFTVIGQQCLVGWQDEATTGRAIEQLIREARRRGAPDVVAGLRTGPAPPGPPGLEKPAVPETLKVPVVGEINLKYLSLGLVTIIIGALDGFNPCAMWVLIFLINLLLGMTDRNKMWILGGAFIGVSGVVYFLFMTAWLNLLVFLGFLFWVRLIIGMVALGAAAFNLKAYFTDTSGVCTLSHGARRRQTMARLKEIIQTRKFFLALGGIVVLAFLVNLVELICSAGFPVVYLQILSLTSLPFWQYYLYLLLYIAVFMLDDIIIFVVAMITLQLMGVTTQYKKCSDLIGGVLMLIIGVLLIFKPEWLMFG